MDLLVSKNIEATQAYLSRCKVTVGQWWHAIDIRNDARYFFTARGFDVYTLNDYAYIIRGRMVIGMCAHPHTKSTVNTRIGKQNISNAIDSLVTGMKSAQVKA